MKPNKNQATFMNIGGSSLLVTFLVLCIAVFAILSLSRAQSDYTFNERLASHKKEYYEASNLAEQILHELAGNNLNNEILGVPIFHDALEDNASAISFQIPINDTQALFVELQLTSPESSSPTEDIARRYHIKSWQTIPLKK